MKKRGWTVFCILFLLLAALPALLTPILGYDAAGANETLSAKPQLLSGGTLNADVLEECASYLNDRYALRQELITGYNAIVYGIFHQAAAENVTAGKDDTLFYTPALEDYMGANELDDRSLFCAVRNLALLQEACEAQGIQFLCTIAPNKASIQPQWVPDSAQKGTTNPERLAEALQAQGVSYCDLFSVLQNRDRETYYHRDSHWNGYGSALACDAIMQALGKESRLAEEAFSMQGHLGDLQQMLLPASQKEELAPALARERTFSYVGSVRGDDDLKISTVCSDAEGSVLMFRDSFGNNLHKDIAEQFASACFSRAMPYDMTMAEELQPDVVLVELVERNISQLAKKMPILRAPVRQPEEAAEAGETAAYTVLESKLDGCVLYEGRFESDLSSDARVFVLVDGTAYEACICPEGFSAHAPAGGDIQILVQSGKTLYRCKTVQSES